MLWRMSADPRARKLGVMSSHRVRKVCDKRPSRPPAGRHPPVPQPPSGSGNCANCPIALSSRFPGPYCGAQEFPVAGRLSRAISCRVVSQAGRSADRRSAKPVAGRAGTPGWTSRREARLAGGAGVLRALTLCTPIPRLPGLCLSGPFRSELSARSADRGRVVPVLDRFSRRSPIAPFAPSFP
jgi:hypothetical protein